MLSIYTLFIIQFRQWTSKLVDHLKLENMENEKEYPLLMDAIAGE